MNPFTDLIMYEDTDGVECRFVKPLKIGAMIWQRTNEHEYVCRGMDFSKVTKQILIEADIWSALNDSTQARIEQSEKDRMSGVYEKVTKMHEARRAKRGSLSQLPKELVCACGHKVTANWTVLNKKADKLLIPAIELAKNYKCQKCNPTKGRRKKEVV